MQFSNIERFLIKTDEKGDINTDISSIYVAVWKCI